MKILQRLVLVLFSLLLMLPLMFFEGRENVTSQIDNRKLTEFPFREGAPSQPFDEKLAVLGDYISDRIGFRNEMIQGYTLLHSALFGLEHPNYMQGEDGFIFLKTTRNVELAEYHESFARMVIRMDRYLKERGVPFLFVFTPAKTSVYPDKLPRTMNYSSEWVGQFLKILEENGVRYVDNTETMIQKRAEGEVVFNQKFNAGHWNDLGAFYGVNRILEAMWESFPRIHINSKEEFTVTQRLNTALQNSRFPIREYEPIFSLNHAAENITASYAGEVAVHPNYRHFYATINPSRTSPRTLSFQGSYMINMGYKFMANALNEYIGVHDYQNVMELDYYFNLFEPQAVIFEVAEYTLENQYFQHGRMKQMDLAPPYAAFSTLAERPAQFKGEQIRRDKGKALTTLSVAGLPRDTKYAYLQIGGTWRDLHKETADEGARFSITLTNGSFPDSPMILSTIDRRETAKTVYSLK